MTFAIWNWWFGDLPLTFKVFKTCNQMISTKFLIYISNTQFLIVKILNKEKSRFHLKNHITVIYLKMSSAFDKKHFFSYGYYQL